ncbi:MAG: hypothetical protein M1814_003319 [Vezdaea aestivalis]|nr:MAG: hypothetical protein M1814_003319 [Vezdaea aestivalis]
MNHPPPPPPHGEQPKSSGLPNGNYDVFIIPPHSAGGGFVYLPSLQPHRNSFLAGAACTGILVLLYQLVLPAVRSWFASMMASGGIGVIILVLVVGLAGWVWGKTQMESSGTNSGTNSGGNGPGHANQNQGGPFPNGDASGGQQYGHSNGGPSPNYGPPPGHGPPPGGHGPGPGPNSGARPKPSWQRTHTSTAGSTTGSTSGASPRSTWEQKKEETRRRQEEQKVREQKEEADRRAKEAAENLRKEHARTREREAREREARDKEAKENEAKEKEAREGREKEAREKRAKEIREMRDRERREKEDRQSQAESPPKRHQQPTARTYMGSDEDAFSFRPYDKPKRHTPKQESHSSFYSESSYAASHSTSRTTPPPSQRGRYTTKDPDKIVIKAVYCFSSAFAKLPTSQLVSGVGSVTDGLILRITTEGLFIDDDVRSVPQREWDVKAWTMKLVEVGCPFYSSHYKRTASAGRLFLPSPVKTIGKEAENVLVDLLEACTSKCKVPFPLSPSHSSLASSRSNKSSVNGSPTKQSGELKGLHVLRASIRDQDGKKYFFVLDDSEGWKVAVGLQRLRKGSQVRALGVTSIGVQETRTLLQTLGWVV